MDLLYRLQTDDKKRLKTGHVKMLHYSDVKERFGNHAELKCHRNSVKHRRGMGQRQTVKNLGILTACSRGTGGKYKSLTTIVPIPVPRPPKLACSPGALVTPTTMPTHTSL